MYCKKKKNKKLLKIPKIRETINSDFFPNIGDDFHRSNMRENHHPRRLLGISTFPSLPPIRSTHPHPLPSSRRSLCPRQTIVRIVLCAAAENLQSSLDCAQGLLWRSPPPHTYVRSAPPATPAPRRRRSTTKRV